MTLTLYPGWPHPPESKRCSGCHSWLPRRDFNAGRRNHDGLQPYCRVCQHEMNKVSVEKSRTNLGATYVKQVIQQRTRLPWASIPPALIEAKRLQLQLFRSTR